MLLSLGCFAPLAIGGDVVFSDSAFNLSNYFSTPIFTTAGDAVTVSQCASCGNPGSALQFVGILGGGSQFQAYAEVGEVNATFVYTPATQGAVQSISVSLDKDLTINPAGVQTDTVFPMIEQDGKYYLTKIVGLSFQGGSSGFVQFAQTGLVASDFVLYDFTTGTALTGNPNFAGDPMMFGLAEIFSKPGNGSGTGTAVYDNLTFDVVNGSTSPALSVAPAAVNFSVQGTQNTPLEQSIVVQNSGVGSFTFNASIAGGSAWLSISPTSGTVSPGMPVIVTVTATPGLSTGGYRDAVHFTTSISGPAGSVDVPVGFLVGNPGPIVSAAPTGVLFTMVQGEGLSAAQTVTIANTGTAGTTVAWNVIPASGPGIPNDNFLAFNGTTGASGQVQPGVVGTLRLSLNSNASTLAPGAYYELVEILAAGAQNSPQYVTAILNVLPSSTKALPVVTPAGLVFTGVAGQGIASQTLTVNASASSAQPQVVQLVSSAKGGLSWLQTIPAGGIASTGSPLMTMAEVNTTGLAAGVYSGTIDVFGIGPPILESVNVTLILTPGGSATPMRETGVRPQATISGCTPSALVLTETGIPNNFSVPADWPADLIVTMADDCGNLIDGASVAANFSNGDAPLALDDQGAGGQYIGTWQPSKLSNTVVILNGSGGALKPATAKLSGLVTQNQAPILAPNGILNNLNPLVGGALAPGTVAAAFGSGLTTSQIPVSPGVSPLPTEFQNTQLIVGGFVAPLYFLSNLQLNVEIPAELAALQQYPAVGVVNGALSLPVMVSVVPITPGVATNQDGTVIAQHSDFSLITPESPAHPGEAAIIYLVGMGATTPAVASGMAAPGLNIGDTLASATVQPVVQVGLQTAKILYAGLTPGGIGLYQIDFVVPSGVGAGNMSLTVSQGGVNANSATLPVATP